MTEGSALSSWVVALYSACAGCENRLSFIVFLDRRDATGKGIPRSGESRMPGTLVAPNGRTALNPTLQQCGAEQRSFPWFSD